MMRVLVLFLFLAWASAEINNNDQFSETSRLKIPSEKELTEKAENLRDSYKEKYNNIIFTNLALPIEREDLGISANITASGHVKGLLDFDVNVTSRVLVKHTLHLNWNTKTGIDVNIEPYDLKGFIHMIQIFGNGKLSINLKNLNIDVEATIKIDFKNKTIHIIKVEVSLNLNGAHKFELTGWLGDEVRSKIITDFVNNNLKDILDEYKKDINELLGKLAFDFVKDMVIPLPE